MTSNIHDYFTPKRSALKLFSYKAKMISNLFFLMLLLSQLCQAQIPAVVDLANLDPTTGQSFNNNHCEGPIVSGQCSGLTVVGDINGDGYVDSMYSVPSSDINGADSGTVFVLFGSEQFDAMISPDEFPLLDGDNGFMIHGINENDGLRGSTYQNDLNGDDIDDFLLIARGYDHVEDNTGAVYIVFGTTGDFPATFDLSTLNGSNGFVIYGENTGDQIGGINTRGDFNGDQLNDIMISAFRSDEAADNAGAAYVLFSQSSNMPTTIDLGSLNGTNGFAIYGENQGDLLGVSAGFIGDVNGDGFADIGVSMADDFIVGRAYDLSLKRGPNDFKTAFVIYGSDATMTATFDLSTINSSNGIIINGLNEADDHSYIRRAGDFNHDGVDDFLVNLIGSDLNGTGTGSVYMVFGNDQGFQTEINLADFSGQVGVLFNGVSVNDNLGSAITNPSDVNYDGIDDLVFGSRRSSTINGNFSGTVYVVYGSTSEIPDVFDLTTLNGNNGFSIYGSDGFQGISPNVIYDVNDDDVNDMLLNGSFGKSYVVYGSEIHDVIFTSGFD